MKTFKNFIIENIIEVTAPTFRPRINFSWIGEPAKETRLPAVMAVSKALTRCGIKNIGIKDLQSEELSGLTFYVKPSSHNYPNGFPITQELNLIDLEDNILNELAPLARVDGIESITYLGLSTLAFYNTPVTGQPGVKNCAVWLKPNYKNIVDFANVHKVFDHTAFFNVADCEYAINWLDLLKIPSLTPVEFVNSKKHAWCQILNNAILKQITPAECREQLIDAGFKEMVT